MSDQIKLTESQPEAFKANYESLAQMPNDVAASRLVQSFILAEGNLIKMKEIVTHFLDEREKDSKIDRAKFVACAQAARDYCEYAIASGQGDIILDKLNNAVSNIPPELLENR